MVHRNLGELGTLVIGAVLITAIGCSKPAPEKTEEPTPPPADVPTTPAPAPSVAIAELHGGEGSSIAGTVTFTQSGDAVTITANVSGVSPAGDHGFHIHEVGECSGDFTSAGGHFAPEGHPHGGPGLPESHAGDMGNISVGDDGVGALELTSNAISVDPGPHSVVGRAVILHEKADDLESQPTGAAGGRLACGVIRGTEEVGAAADAPAH